ncbi:MAG: hypothetical protein ACI9MR_002780, partial [Myxococcota bacterium]
MGGGSVFTRLRCGAGGMVLASRLRPAAVRFFDFCFFEVVVLDVPVLLGVAVFLGVGVTGISFFDVGFLTGTVGDTAAGDGAVWRAVALDAGEGF